MIIARSTRSAGMPLRPSRFVPGRTDRHAPVGRLGNTVEDRAHLLELLGMAMLDHCWNEARLLV
jgi:hypothetical protein